MLNFRSRNREVTRSDSGATMSSITTRDFLSKRHMEEMKRPALDDISNVFPDEPQYLPNADSIDKTPGKKLKVIHPLHRTDGKASTVMSANDKASTVKLADGKTPSWTQEEDEALRSAVQVHNARNWKLIAECVPNRTDVQCLHRWQKVLNPILVKGYWSKEEDDRVIELVNMFGTKRWAAIARCLPGRNGKQCRERWCNHLDPKISREPWTDAEDMLLFLAHSRYGNKWAEISKLLPRRSDNGIKNRWNTSVKKKARQMEQYTKFLNLENAVQHNGTHQDIGTARQVDQYTKFLNLENAVQQNGIHQDSMPMEAHHVEQSEQVENSEFYQGFTAYSKVVMHEYPQSPFVKWSANQAASNAP